MDGIRRFEPVRNLSELHQAAVRVPHIQFVHAPGRFDDLAHIDAPGEVRTQRVNVV